MPSRRTEGLPNNMVNERFLCNPFHRFLKEFQLFPRVMSLMTEWRSRRRPHAIMVACRALEAVMKDQVEQLNTIGVAATAMGID